MTRQTSSPHAPRPDAPAIGKRGLQRSRTTGDGPRLRRTQIERREDSERRLLEAALTIVARTGTMRLTLAEVGAEAGYSRGLATHRFGSKAGLLRALAAHINASFHAQMQAAPPRKDGLDAIRGHIVVYFGRTGQSWTTTRALLVMMTEGLIHGAEIQRDMAVHTQEAVKFFEHHIRIGQRKGEIRADVNPGTDAVLLLGTLRGVMLQALLEESFNLRKVRDRLLAIVDRTLAQGPAAAGRG